MGGLRWIGDRRDLEDHRFEPPAIWSMGDGVDGNRAVTFTPPGRFGPFTFPSPYHSPGIRLTDASNAPHGCQPRLYPYWSVINNHRGRPELAVFLGRLGTTPIMLSVNKATGAVSTSRELPWISTGEGCYFSDTDPDRLYFLDSNRLSVLAVSSGTASEVFTLDAKYGNDLWQAHSSADNSVHSATVRRRTTDGPYEVLGCVVYRHGDQTFFPASANLDECQIDKSGRWLIAQVGGANVIHDLQSERVRVIADAEGALAHLDVGDGIMVGEDDSGDNWRMRLWDLTDGSTRVIHEGTPPWNNGLGHLAVRGGRALLSSNATGELIDVSLADGSSRLIAPGMIRGDGYDYQLRACLDPTGEYACWIAYVAGRFDAFLVRLSPLPPVIVTPDPGGTPVTPLDTLNALRAQLPATNLGDARLAGLMNAVAWIHRAEGYGLLRKPSGAHGPQPQTGIFVSRDILMLKNGRIFDCLIDSDGKATPTWGEKDPLSDLSRWVAPVDAGVTMPAGPPANPPPTGGEAVGHDFPQRYPDEPTWWTAFLHEVDALYVQADQAWNLDTFKWVARTAYDIGTGMEKERSKAKHLAELRQALGL